MSYYEKLRKEYYDKTREYRGKESEIVMIQFRSRTFFEPPTDRPWSEPYDSPKYCARKRWEEKQDKRFIRWECTYLTKAQAVVRGMLTRRVVNVELLSPDADTLPRAVDYCVGEKRKRSPVPDLEYYRR